MKDDDFYEFVRQERQYEYNMEAAHEAAGMACCSSDEMETCFACNGSGEGYTDGTTCQECKGKGEVMI
jgi:DnaJ-class molecular chaperone